ncbi:acetyl-CoA acetyltransferase [Novosphingobium sp. FKTRR1]|uniref:acetyl-CoA acetyltransferase n=1 Tax=Novosphingobium sp. FKTRR1 TaxID=2879118 RepID=UPI001CF00BD7|nr:acetyl-CoA acetyltransferase [Novosphingobium sp. FKTRR1]
MTISDRTPVIVGVGQSVERIEAADYQGVSAAELAARAADAALADSGVAEIARGLVKIVGAVRTFEDSNAAPSPFGKPDKFPLAIARRLGITPSRAVLEKVGGQSPVTILAEMGDRILAGESEAALVFGAEAISSTRYLSGKGEVRDWAEALDGEIDDHGFGMKGLLSPLAIAHGITAPPIAYALMENARRARLGLDKASYALAMGALFAPFSAVAAANPYSSAASQALSADEIATPGERNRLVTDPYTIKLVSRDQVNQGAAVLLMSVGAARAAGIPEDRWTFVHAATHAQEKEVLARPALDAYPAANAAIAEALAISGKRIDAFAAFDFYSCFPIPVFNAAIEGLGLAADDPRGLTVTGGLPYFGGAGNNYSMHAIASMVDRLRTEARGSFGLVGANGGFQSKYAALVLSGTPAPWRPLVADPIQQALDTVADIAPVAEANGNGTIETYTVWRAKGVPASAIAIGHLADGSRFVANAADPETLAQAAETDPLGATVSVRFDGKRNLFNFAA